MYEIELANSPLLGTGPVALGLHNFADHLKGRRRLSRARHTRDIKRRAAALVLYTLPDVAFNVLLL